MRPRTRTRNVTDQLNAFIERYKTTCPSDYSKCKIITNKFSRKQRITYTHKCIFLPK